MVFLKKIKFEKLKNLPIILAQRAFLTFFVLFIFSLIISGMIFYQYSVLAKKKVPAGSEKLLKFEEKTYQEILKIWEEREKKFQEADLKTYSNPFY